ncbi:MAG: 4-hydroxythreonine-4-phosphate dehydrogenase PdxA [Deltaproteobacteria bacterium]|nr:4-hydroxythreonine-4-phosphate dehydrogenase PdxA [Deltaproteobacteria bacterium]MBW1962788.1 4-hydroxythreonine-4-phosphate dehydrogenase PdxA [Deltaproteobacteria bacterium]MBW1993815.1 4-hydroxythreonine-4-phosphate dehydrogenase PdxA [Deltaproteobacteria bacterium]MBW2150470.1 4-hydroxythreonine-4-phosphate dehydrogenase PdxA [Deltaproteobacteria bacterium]
MANRLPRVGITMGDAAGIGPEIAVKSLANPELYRLCNPVVLGDTRVIEAAVKLTNTRLDVRSINTQELPEATPGLIHVIDYHNVDPATYEMGAVNPKNGDAAVHYTKEAGRMCLDGRLDAMVSAPLNKESMREAGYNYEGQTQILAELCNARRHGMALILGDLRIMLLTTHMALAEAIARVKKDRVKTMLELAWELLTFIGVPDPVIAVSGLNPHAGEGGLFGREEIDEIVPAIEECRSNGINVVGPLPADTVFHRANQGEFDLVLALYHDQGLMAVKLLGFGHAVTLLAGIPIIRTSTGHGTAFDIAGKNIADHTNLYKAIVLAAQLAVKKVNRQ